MFFSKVLERLRRKFGKQASFEREDAAITIKQETSTSQSSQGYISDERTFTTHDNSDNNPFLAHDNSEGISSIPVEKKTLATSPRDAASPDAEEALRQLLEKLDKGAFPAEQINPHQTTALLFQMAKNKNERDAIDMARRLLHRIPHQTAIQFSLAKLLFELKEYSEALKPLNALTEDPDFQAPSHFMLGEYHYTEGNLELALRHYEAVLAVDFTFPRARGRADFIRKKIEQPRLSLGPTILGADNVRANSRFVLQRELGRGSSGTVYLAHDRSLNRPIALKVLHPQLTENQAARTRFFCEARIAAALRDPRIVTIFDLDETLKLIAMEHCAGGSLSDLMAHGPLPLAAALHRLVEIASVLKEVHRFGVIHRDLKPSNLLFRRPFEEYLNPVVVTDFGIAHLEQEAKAETCAAGTLLYIAPECRKRLDIDQRSDLYSCGVILLEMLLGYPPLNHQQTLLGVPLIENDEIWRHLKESMTAHQGHDVLKFTQTLVDANPEKRAQNAEVLVDQAHSLIKGLKNSTI